MNVAAVCAMMRRTSSAWRAKYTCTKLKMKSSLSLASKQHRKRQLQCNRLVTNTQDTNRAKNSQNSHGYFELLLCILVFSALLQPHRLQHCIPDMVES
jgi:hypothetical protein